LPRKSRRSTERRESIPVFLTPPELEREMRLAEFSPEQCVRYLNKSVLLGEVPGWLPVTARPVYVDPFSPSPGNHDWTAGLSPGLHWIQPEQKVATYVVPAGKSRAELSRKISLDEFDNVHSAACFANSRGWVLNVGLDITWGCLQLKDETKIGKALSKFLELFRHFCDYRGLPCVWIYCNERGVTHGLHTHLAIHLPFPVRSEFRRWRDETALRTISGSTNFPRQARQDNWGQNGNVEGQKRRLRYCLKGIDPSIAFYWTDDPDDRVLLWREAGIEPEPVGIMSIDRIGVSKSIGPGARKATKFASPLCGGQPLFSDCFYRDWWTEKHPGRNPSSELWTRIAPPEDDDSPFG
jgi:hypothetical protein